MKQYSNNNYNNIYSNTPTMFNSINCSGCTCVSKWFLFPMHSVNVFYDNFDRSRWESTVLLTWKLRIEVMFSSFCLSINSQRVPSPEYVPFPVRHCVATSLIDTRTAVICQLRSGRYSGKCPGIDNWGYKVCYTNN